MRLICWNKGGCKNNSNTPEYYGCNGETEKVVQCCAEYNGFYDTIEALQQENKQLRAKLDDWKYDAQCHMDEVVIREEQIEQLRAQVARMKEALKQCEYIGDEGLSIDKGTVLMIKQALSSDAGKDYHNPADVEALRKAKEAFDEIVNPTKYMRKRSPETFDPMRYYGIEDNAEYLRSIAKEALAEIEKALGGGQGE